MTKVRLIKKNNDFIKLEVCGHSNYDESGKDIVCAAISTMTQSLIIGLEEVISKDFTYSIDPKKAKVMVDISEYTSENMEKAQILFNTFKLTVDRLLMDYKKYVKMKIEEEY